MAEPRKIRVLYFDESPDTMAGFIDFCGNKEIIEIIGAFRSFRAMASILVDDDFRLLNSFYPDVLVIKVTDPENDICPELEIIRNKSGIRLIGLLCGACSHDSNLFNKFDYHVSTPSRNGLLTDEDVCIRLLYQIKSARLELNTEKFGVKGKWVFFPPKSATFSRRRYKIVAIGASAGGTEAVTEVLSNLPDNMPPILIVQHIPENFSDFFANNLKTRVVQKVCVARGGEKLECGNVYIAGYDKHLEVVRGDDGEFYTKCTFSDKVSGHRPSVDVLFRSVAKSAGQSAIGVILTGMGSDGAQGLLEMHESGAYTIGQDNESSVVYGMPMVAYTMGAVTKQLPLNCIAKAIIKVVTHDEREDN